MHLLCTTLPQDTGRVGIAFADKGGGVLCLKVAVTVSMANAVWGTSSFPGYPLGGQKLSCWVPFWGCMQVIMAIDCFLKKLFWYDIILIMIMKIYEAFVHTLHAVGKKWEHNGLCNLAPIIFFRFPAVHFTSALFFTGLLTTQGHHTVFCMRITAEWKFRLLHYVTHSRILTEGKMVRILRAAMLRHNLLRKLIIVGVVAVMGVTYFLFSKYRWQFRQNLLQWKDSSDSVGSFVKIEVLN